MKNFMRQLDGIDLSDFVGFETVSYLQQTKCQSVPNERGVYLVIRSGNTTPVFLENSVGGHFKGKNPTVSTTELTNNWVTNAKVLYIGKAGSATGEATLKSRLHSYMKFGLGKPVGHRGGRYIWQLSDVGELQVGWKTLPHTDPAMIESELIAGFKAVYGKRPFANLRD